RDRLRLLGRAPDALARPARAQRRARRSRTLRSPPGDRARTGVGGRALSRGWRRRGGARRARRADARIPALCRPAREIEMIDALLVSNALLWLLVLALAAVAAALARQVGVLHERLAPLGALAIARGPAPGEAAPILFASALSGETVQIGGANDSG